MYSVNIRARQHPGVFELSNISKVQQGEQEIAGLEGQLSTHTGGVNQNAHSIDNISNLRSTLEGKEPVISKNSAFNKDFGTSQGTVCEGDDSRLSDSRNPNPHSHSLSDVDGLTSALSLKADKSSITTTVTVITGVDFTNESFVTSTFKIVDGIIVEII